MVNGGYVVLRGGSGLRPFRRVSLSESLSVHLDVRHNMIWTRFNILCSNLFINVTSIDEIMFRHGSLSVFTVRFFTSFISAIMSAT